MKRSSSGPSFVISHRQTACRIELLPFLILKRKTDLSFPFCLQSLRTMVLRWPTFGSCCFGLIYFVRSSASAPFPGCNFLFLRAILICRRDQEELKNTKKLRTAASGYRQFWTVSNDLKQSQAGSNGLKRSQTSVGRVPSVN